LTTRPAAQSTIDALMYVLRSGITALEKPDNLRRLGELDDAQLRACVGQLLKRSVAPSWTQDEVGVLIASRKRLHEHC
jgi:hypothetical protein